jgi:long-chain fatty acid transport protein
MNKRAFSLALLVGGAGLACPPRATAFDTLFSAGYGAPATGMGGASMAQSLDSLGGANNPASMAFVGNRIDSDLAIFAPNAGGSFLFPGNDKHTGYGLVGGNAGANWQITPKISLGMTIWGSGLIVRYPQYAIPGLSKRTLAAQVLYYHLTPVVAYRPLPWLSVGFGVNLTESRANVQGFPASIGGELVELPGHNKDVATGYGFRFGGLAQVTPKFSVGVSFMTKTQMTKFRRYGQDLLASTEGEVDEPGMFGAGFSYKLTSKLTAAFDYLRIFNSESSAFANPASFGWQDMNVYRGGVSYQLTPRLVARAGWNHGTPFYDREHVSSNIGSPWSGDAGTLGAGYRTRFGTLDVSYEHLSREGRHGTGPSEGSSTYLGANNFQLQYSSRF